MLKRARVIGQSRQAQLCVQAKKSLQFERVAYRAPPALTLSGFATENLHNHKATSWFVAPVHQMQQYYRLGTLDNCSGKWSSLVDSLTLKTKRSAEVQEILETREKAKLHIWTFRTTEEASSNWKEQFGHLDEME